MNTILVIDDDARIRRVLFHMLKAAGYEVLEASNGADALAHLNAWRPELVITDVIMPGTNGVEVSREIRLNHPEIPVMAMSGSNSGVADALGSGADRMLLKPFGRHELLSAIEDLLPQH